MFKKLQDMHTQASMMKDQAEAEGNKDLGASLAGVCLFLRTACEKACGEGKPGDQTTALNRPYVSAKSATVPAEADLAQRAHEKSLLNNHQGLPKKVAKDLIGK
jgi:hypothetical protein